jgi:hypothetical protein
MVTWEIRQIRVQQNTVHAKCLYYQPIFTSCNVSRFCFQVGNMCQARVKTSSDIGHSIFFIAMLALSFCFHFDASFHADYLITRFMHAIYCKLCDCKAVGSPAAQSGHLMHLIATPRTNLEAPCKTYTRQNNAVLSPAMGHWGFTCPLKFEYVLYTSFVHLAQRSQLMAIVITYLIQLSIRYYSTVTAVVLFACVYLIIT